MAETTSELRELGLAAYRSGGFTDALRCFSNYLALQPDDHEIRSKLALTYSALRMHVEAQMAIDHLLALRPHSVSANYYKARILERGGQIPEACERLRYVLALRPDHDQARELLATLESQVRSAGTVVASLPEWPDPEQSAVTHAAATVCETKPDLLDRG